MIALADRRFWLLCAAFLLLLLTFMLPAVHAARPVYKLVAVLDITGSMNARDQSANGRKISRIEMEKRALTSMLAALPCGSRLGVGIFVEERPFLLFEPVETCGNYAPLAQSIEGIGWRMGWDSESHIAGGLRAAMAMARDLDADLVFMTDGQEIPPLSWSAPVDFGPLRGAVSGMLVGVGGAEFVPIPKFDNTGHEIGVWKPGQVPSETGGLFKGHEYLTEVNEPHLKELATATGLTYFHVLQADQLYPQVQHAVPRRTQQTTVDMRAVPAAFAVLLLALCCLDHGFALPWPARLRRPGQAPLFNSTGSRR